MMINLFKNGDIGDWFLEMKVVVHRFFANIAARLISIRLGENIFTRADGHDQKPIHQGFFFYFTTLWNYFFVILTEVKFPLPDAAELPFSSPTINLHLFVY